jgi:hypothetical protein
MKKNLTALLLALAMTLSLAACGGNQPAEDETDAPAVEENLPAVEPEVEVDNVVTELPEVDPEADTPASSTDEPEAMPSMPTVDPESTMQTPEVETPEVTPEVKPEENTPSVAPEQSAPAADSVDLNAFYETFALAQGEDNWPFMMLAEGEMLDGFFPGLTGIATKQCYAYLPAMSAVAAEFVLVEVENASDIEAVKAIMQARIDAQVAGGAWYPETIEGWKTNSRIVTNGNHIVMAVFSDVDAFVSEFNGLFA